jgi:hypothetical protein
MNARIRRGALAGALLTGAATAVTLQNFSEVDLLVTREAGLGSTPMFVAGYCDAQEHLLCRCADDPTAFARRFQGSDCRPSPGRPEFEYLLEGGDGATFTFGEGGEDGTASLVIERADWQGTVSFHGLLIYRCPSLPLEAGPAVPWHLAQRSRAGLGLRQ